jgi:tetratricopeptide (TPR) repeat protein
LIAGAALAQVTVSQDTITLKTWREGPPDINPWFELFPSDYYPVYPYTLRKTFLPDTSDVAWRELTIQNEYLSCRVFPDLGGHLYSCLDKIANVEMFYANPVIRKALVGLRGAWAALGIELNFPVGHSLVSVSPVSFGTQKHPDGSAGVWVADIDRQTGLEWRVEFVLRPGSTMLEQNVWMYNRGDVRQPYYWWSDASVKIEDRNDTFVLPTHLVAAHGETFIDAWPLSKAGVTNQAGVDLSLIGNYNNGTGLFSYGSNEPFFAAYHPKTKTATVHYADPTIMPGKKLWTWGPGASGDPWVEANLTEKFPSYIETQSGVTPNQETRLWLDPQQEKHFTEYWMPARQLRGISRANINGVLYLGRSTSNLVAEFNANRTIKGASVKILNGTTIVYQEPAPADLLPTTTFQRSIPISDASAQYTFQILDSNGNVLLTHTENQYSGQTAADVKLGAQPAPNLTAAGSEQDVLFRAGFHEQYQQYALAEADYNMGLQLFPSSVALRKGLGRLAYLSARYDDAASMLAQVTAQAPDDREAHFYLGLAYAALGRHSAAVDEWTGIRSTPDFGKAASFELGILRVSSGDLAGAVTLFDAVSTVRAAGMEIAVLRHQGNTQKVQALLAQWLTSNPTDLFLRYESYLTTPDATLLNDLGTEPERVLNLVDDYMRLKFYGDADTLLTRTYSQENALLLYYRGYCRQQIGASPSADFDAASHMASIYVFPNRASSFAVLRAAIQANANDATAHNLLGLLYMSKRQIDNAIAEWEAARALNEKLPALDRNLGRAYLDLKADPAKALKILSAGRTREASNSDLQDAHSRASSASQAYSGCHVKFAGPSSASVEAPTSLVSVSFTASPECAWTAPQYLGWITATTPASGKGNGSVSYAIAANPGATGRTENLTIAGKAFTITQAAAAH